MRIILLAWALVQRRWLDALIGWLVLLGALSLLSALDRHGIEFVRAYRYGSWRFNTDAIHSHTLATAPLWLAATLHLLRRFNARG